MLVVGWKNIRTLPPQTKNAIAMMKKLTSFLVAALLLLLGACSGDVLDLGADLPEDSVDTGGGYNIYRPNTLQMDYGFRYRYNNQAEIK